jgi:hypothetical protein
MSPFGFCLLPFALFLPFLLSEFTLPHFLQNLLDGNTALGSFHLGSFAFGLLGLPNPIRDTPISELLLLDSGARVVGLRLYRRRAMENAEQKRYKTAASPGHLCYSLA